MAADHHFLSEGTTCRHCGVYFDDPAASKPCGEGRSDTVLSRKGETAFILLAFVVIVAVGMAMIPFLSDPVIEETRNPEDLTGQRIQ